MGAREEAAAERQLYEIHNRNHNMLVPHWLILGWLYYHRDVNLVTDAFYDRVGKDMIRYWAGIEHFHKYLIPNLGELSGFGIRYPQRTQDAACFLYNIYNPRAHLRP